MDNRLCSQYTPWERTKQRKIGSDALAMRIELTDKPPETHAVELLALPFAGTPSASLSRIDGLLGGRLERLVASGDARSDAGALVLLFTEEVSGVSARRVALCGVGPEGDLDTDAVRAGAAAAARAVRQLGGTLVWA